MSGALDRHGQRPLVTRTSTELPARLDLSSLCEVPAKAGNVLVVHGVDAINAEHAGLAARLVAPSAASTTWPTAPAPLATVSLLATARLGTGAKSRSPSAIGTS